MRLNKYVAHHSTYSRREADETIKLGFIKVNDQVMKDPAYDVKEGSDEVRLKGKLLVPNDIYTIIVYNKRKGELVTKTDPKGRKTIFDTLGHKFRHFTPVGRLDFTSEGLLLLTDSSPVATALMESDVERVYKIKIKGPITPAMEASMRDGMHLDDASKGAHTLTGIKEMDFAPFSWYKIQKNRGDYSILKVAITEGKNRELRRFFAHFDAEVVDLKRLAYGSIELSALPDGKSRFLTRKEYSDVKDFMKRYKKEQKEKRDGKNSTENAAQDGDA